MSARREQYDWRGTRTSWRHWKSALKRSTAKWMRRQGKRLMDDVPTRSTAGWAR